MMKTSYLWLIVFLGFIVSASYAETAYREKIITPHWKWASKSKSTAIRAMFLTNNKATREPEELAERFNIEATIVPVSGNSYKNKFDEAFIAAALAEKPDVIVIAARGVWRDLSVNCVNSILSAVEAGTPMLLYSAPMIDCKIKEALSKKNEVPFEFKEITEALPMSEMSFRTRKGLFGIKKYAFGKGFVYSVPGYDNHWCFFTAFFPRHYYDFKLLPKYEFFYALAAKTIRAASGKLPDQQIQSISPSAKTAGNDSIDVKVKFDKAIPRKSRIAWALYSPFGGLLKKGEVQTSGAQSITLAVPNIRDGKQILRLRLDVVGKTIDYGACIIDIPESAKIADLNLPKINISGKEVKVKWKGETSGDMILQVYDPDGRMVAGVKTSIPRHEAMLPDWKAKFVSHTLRALVVKNGRVVFERRIPFEIRIDRSEDTKEFQGNVWGTEYGSYPEKWRYRRLREFGITSTTVQGARDVVPRMASQSGLRLVPTNVCNPPNRFNRFKFDVEKRSKYLSDTASRMQPFATLGYSLADEPAGSGLVEFRNWATKIIDAKDDGAKVGFCGMWMGVGKNVPKIMNACDYIVAYSPHYLYTSNLWLGIERDLFRSFVKKDTIYSAWTNYVPQEDCEPYSRTMPWLMLFEGGNGVSYFDSGGSFAVLGADLRASHEARWFGSEIREINRGIGRLLIGMRRKVGSVRILFGTEVPKRLVKRLQIQTELWVKILNERNIPYKFISKAELPDLNVSTVKLLLCPATPTLSKNELKSVAEFAKSGGVVMAMPPFGLIAQLGKERSEPFWVSGHGKIRKRKPNSDKLSCDVNNLRELFGFKRCMTGNTSQKEVVGEVTKRSGVPLEITWNAQFADAIGLKPQNVPSGGAPSLKMTTGKILAEFQWKHKEKAPPEYISAILATPAMIQNSYGKGTTYYVNMLPDANTASKLLDVILQKAKVNLDLPKVLVNAASADHTYIYPMSDSSGIVSAYGVIRNYHLTPPTLQISDKRTAAYFNHGPKLWQTEKATFLLPSSKHCYDSRTGKYFGKVKEFKFSLRPGEPKLFAALPYKVDKVKIEAPSKIVCGEKLNLKVSLFVSDGKTKIGRHVVNLTLKPLDAKEEFGYSQNITLLNGTGSATIQTAFNDFPGEWTLIAKEAMSGVSISRKIEFIRTASDFGDFLEIPKLRVIKEPINWPAGKWKPYKKATIGNKVKTWLSPLRRIKVNYGRYPGKLHLLSRFGLQNREVNYGMVYFAMNDWKAMKWKDKRQVKTNAGSGLGINRPAAHQWYYNGYISIKFDDKCVTDYRISDIREVAAGTNGRFDVTWDSPYGKATLSFVLTPNDKALYQELKVTPSIPVKKISVTFHSYIAGFNKARKWYVKTLTGTYYKWSKRMNLPPKENPWALYADDVNDRLYGKGLGPGGLLILPEEWTKTGYGYSTLLERDINLKAGDTLEFHWALWIFPKTSNDKAFVELRDGAADTTNTLKTIFKIEN